MTALGAAASSGTTATYPTLADFGHDPWWLVIIKVLAIFVFLLLGTIIAIWAERRVLGRMQQRLGPNRAGKFGLLQTLMDGIKLALKEDIVPRGVDRVLFWTAPAISVITAFTAFAVIPRASAWPWSSSTSASARSVAAETPALVQTLPSWVKMRSPSTKTRG